jgi:hypothetical protein
MIVGGKKPTQARRCRSFADRRPDAGRSDKDERDDVDADLRIQLLKHSNDHKQVVLHLGERRRGGGTINKNKRGTGKSDCHIVTKKNKRTICESEFYLFGPSKQYQDNKTHKNYFYRL